MGFNECVQKSKYCTTKYKWIVLWNLALIHYLEHPECDFYQDKEIEVQRHQHMHSQILHFCGHLSVCKKFNNKVALEIAKSNVNKYYSVVGITENIKDTLRVMEDKLPEFFSGSYNLYLEKHKSLTHNRNKFKPFVSELTKKLLRSNFTHEIEFYNFCKEKLKNQVNNIKIHQWNTYYCLAP